jgi:predicted RNA-binding protein with PUA-like domain
MQPGQQCFFYHSSCKTPAIVGIMEVTKAPYPDDTQFDSNSKYYDPKSDRENPRWYRVDVTLVRRLHAKKKNLHSSKDQHGKRSDVIVAQMAVFKLLID